MGLASVDADRALAEQRVVGFHRLHPGDDRLAVGITFERLHRLEVARLPSVL